MSFNQNRPDESGSSGATDGKNETEIPIGEPQEPAARDHTMWRCGECGEMGRIEEQLPAACPECDTSREELYYWAED